MKGFKKNGKFIPTENRKKSSLKKSDIKKRNDNTFDNTKSMLDSFEQRQKDASMTLDEAKEMAMLQGDDSNKMFIKPKEGMYFPIEQLRFNDTKVKGVWLLADYDGKNGEYFSSQIIKDDKHWNELIDEGRMVAFNNDGTVDEDFKCRDRSCDNIIREEQ